MAAGLGFKTFTTGEVLTAADTNGYLMQGVLVFASAAARDAAITSPQEGQFAYLKDTNVTTYYTGSAWTNLDTTGMTNPMTTTGDMVYSSSGSTPARLGIGSTGQVLTVAGGIPSWAAASGGGTWAAYTPTYTGFSVGNGTVTARYAEVGKIVTAYFRLQFGSTTSMAASNNRISLPVTASAVYLQNQIAGQAAFWDNSLASPYQGLIVFNSGTEVRVMANNRGTTYTYYDYAGSTVPVAYATSDAWEFIITYEAA
jgi:hypothetical protein